MRRFVLFYLLTLLSLFGLLYLDTNFIANVFNQKQTALTLSMIEPFLKTGQLRGEDIVISPYYKIIITQACNGMIPILFYFTAIISYPSRLCFKPLWMAVGYILFTLANVLRILIVVYFVEQKGGRENFFWAHDIFGNVILMTLGFALFILYIKSAAKRVA